MNEPLFLDSTADGISQAFEAFHTSRPEVWKHFQRFTFELINRGFSHYSADAVLHRVRWHTHIEEVRSAWKINNNFVALYARLFHETYPQYEGFFRTRERISSRSSRPARRAVNGASV